MNEEKSKRKHGSSLLAMKPGGAKKSTTGTPSQEGQKRSFAAPDASASAKQTASPQFVRKQESLAGQEGGAAFTPDNNTVFGMIEAKKIKPWRYKDRSSFELEDDPEFEVLVHEIREEGVLTPVLVRPLEKPDGEGHEYEEIAGFKRVSAAKLIGPNTPVPAYIRPMSDLEAARAQKSENRGRSKPSTWSDAVHYKTLLVDGVVKTKADLALALELDRTTCSNMIRIAEKMPEDFIKSIKLTKLSFNALMKMVSETVKLEGKEREELIDRIVEHADEIAEKPEKAVKLLERIVKEFHAKGTEPVPAAQKWSFNSQKGKALSTKKASNQVSFTVHEAALSVVSHEELEEAITKVLEDRGLKLEKK